MKECKTCGGSGEGGMKYDGSPVPIQEDCYDCNGSGEDSDDWGDPGSCPICGEPWQHVRPGKSQPTCDCQDYCSCGTKMTTHSEDEYPDRRMFGWYCEKCYLESVK